MTDEELEKKAKQYSSKYARQYYHNDKSCFTTSEEEVYKAYLEGAKENNIVWHKQSDTDDIYDACNDWYLHRFVCKMNDGSYNIAFGTCDEDVNGIVSVTIWFEHKDSKYYADDIIAWCEIPKFEVEE